MKYEHAGDASIDAIAKSLQQATLRNGVDAAALERFLRAAPELITSALLHFSDFSDAETSELLDAMRQHGASPEQLDEFAQALATAEDEYLVARIAVDPPSAPHLRALWDAVEPGASGLGCSIP